MVWGVDEEWLRTGILPKDRVNADIDQSVAEDFSRIKSSFTKWGHDYLDELQMQIDKLR